MNEDESLIELLNKGYILFVKNGELVKEKAPIFGEVTICYSNDKFTHLTKKETKK